MVTGQTLAWILILSRPRRIADGSVGLGRILKDPYHGTHPLTGMHLFSKKFTCYAI